MSVPARALFICTGNSCRSVMAQFLFNKAARERRLPWESLSCGVAAERYFQVPDGVRKALAARGINEIEHTPQLVTRELLRWADLILPMSRAHAEYLTDQYPEFTDKIHLFLEAAGLSRADVEDPIGKADETYLRCCDLIERGVEALIQKHAPPTTKPRP